MSKRIKRFFIETPETDEVQSFAGTIGDKHLERNLVAAAASAIREMLSSEGTECEIKITTALMTDKQVSELPEV